MTINKKIFRVRITNDHFYVWRSKRFLHIRVLVFKSLRTHPFPYKGEGFSPMKKSSSLFLSPFTIYSGPPYTRGTPLCTNRIDRGRETYLERTSSYTHVTTLRTWFLVDLPTTRPTDSLTYLSTYGFVVSLWSKPNNTVSRKN